MPVLSLSSTCRPGAGIARRSASLRPALRRGLAAAPTNGAKCTALFKGFRGNAEDAGVYGSQGGRDDFEPEDIDYYFEYTGSLAAEGNYDRLDQLKKLGLAPCDLLLLMAAAENDAPKVAELLRAGADTGVKDIGGKTPAELTTSQVVLDMLADRQKAFTY